MIKRKKVLGTFSGNRRTSLRMSKLARIRQSAAAKTNWNETARMLFWADWDQGRSKEVRRLVSGENKHSTRGGDAEGYSADQFRYMFRLMLIISIAETRTQELYRKEFADRCDVISTDHDLQDDQYWDDGRVPPEGESLNTEFEERSVQILTETSREYGQDDIADLMETDGADQLFNIVENARLQFFRVLENSPRGREVPDAPDASTPAPQQDS